MLVAWELEAQVEPICGKVSPFFGHFDKRTLFSRWGIRRMQSRWVVCCSFLLLRLILFLADWTAHFGCGNSGTLHHVLFLSWSCTFLFNGTELLRWLLLRDQYITSAASVPLSQELRPGLGWDISSHKMVKTTRFWHAVIESTGTREEATSITSLRLWLSPGWCLLYNKPLRGRAAGTQQLSDSSLSSAASLPLSILQCAAKCCQFVFMI